MKNQNDFYPYRIVKNEYGIYAIQEHCKSLFSWFRYRWQFQRYFNGDKMIFKTYEDARAYIATMQNELNCLDWDNYKEVRPSGNSTQA